MRNAYPISTYNSNSPSQRIRLRIVALVNLILYSHAASKKSNYSLKWRSLFSILILISLALNVDAQSIFSNSITGANPSSSNPYTTGQTVNANITVTGIERGPGIAAYTLNNAYGATGFQSAALSQAKYFQFTITPGSCKDIDFSSFVYTSSISSGTANFAFRSSVDNYANNIGTASSSGTTISLTAAAYQNITSAITFRMYVWNASSNSIGISINDFTFNGTIGSALPAITTQPTSSATYCQNTSPAALTIAASAGSGSISSYQWYSSTSNSNTSGIAISGANWLSYYPSGATAGTRYYYCKVTNSVGCIATSNVAAVTITPQPSGNFAYSNYGFCNSLTSAQTIATSNLIGTGTFSAGSGLTINATTGAITPSTSTPSTTPYVVTYTVPASGGCSAFSSTTNVTIDAKGTGSISYPTTGLCSSSNAPVSPIISGASGSGNSTWVLGSPSGLAMNGNGVITPSSSTPGNYTITYYRSASGACPEYSTTTSITIGGGFTANAGSDFTKTCTSYTNGHHIGFYDGDSDGQNDDNDDNDGDGNSDNEENEDEDEDDNDDDDDNEVNDDDNQGYTYSWFPTSGLSSSTSSHPTANPSVTTTYTLTKTATGSGCSATDNVTVTVNTTAPIANAGNDFTKTCGTNANGATIGAAAIAGHTYSWSPSTGLSSSTAANPTANPSVTTTYTLTIRNTATGCTATDLVTVTVDLSLPTVSVTPASRCGAGTVTLSATASQGNINWYSSATGGTLLYTGNTFTTPSLSSSTTYYVSAVSGSCTSATRTAVTATIVANPTVSTSTPASRCGAGTVSLAANPSGGSINWYSTLTGGTSLSTGNTFTTPSLSSSTTYYVDATNNGCTTPTRTSVSATINEIPVITAVPASRCGTGTVVLSASTTTGTISWFSAATAGANIGNGPSYTTPSISTSYTFYLSATSNGCTVASRTPITATVNAIPTVANPIAASSCGPGTVTLAATPSAGTINWYTASSAGTLAGSGSSFTTPSLSATTTYYAEAVSNGCSSASRTAVIATITPIPSISSTTAGSRCGTGTVVLGAVASSGTISWFANETGGSAIATGTSYTSPSISASTTYYVSATTAGCTSPSRTAVLAAVNAIPTISTSTSANRCGAGALTLNASASAGTINWFTAATGGASIATGSTYTTASLSSTTNYYVSASENGCTTATRTLITATINTIPTVTSSTGASRCGEGTVTLNAISSSNTLNWYESATGGTSIYTGGSLTTPTLSQTSTYYVDATAANGCTSTNRTSVTATILPVPSVTASTPAERCGNGTVTLSATASAGSVKWYSASTAGTLLSSNASFTTPNLTTTTNYYVEALLGTCSSSSRTVVIATINANPTVSSQSTAAATYIQNATSNALTVTATPGSGSIFSYQWYSNTVANTTSGTAIDGADSLGYFPSTSNSGISYYYCLITNSNGCSVKSAVSGAILVHPLPTITSVIPNLPLVGEQSNNTGYRGQRIIINGSNFSSNATVRFNGTAATSVLFVNATQLSAVVNNTGANSEDVVIVTNPSTTASASAPFSYIGYYTTALGDWSLTSSWLGATLPLVGSDATIAHATTCNTAIAPIFNKICVRPLASLTLGTALSSLKSNTVVVNGTLSFTLSGTLTISSAFNFGNDGIFNPGTGRVIFNNEGDQQLFTGKSSLTFNSITISGVGTKTLGSQSSIQVKNLHLDEGATFNPGILQDVEITGDVELNGNMDPGNSKFRFTGSTNQSISVSGAGTAWFSDLHVNKPSGKILLNSNVQVRDTLKMLSGHIDTQTNTLEIGLNTTRTGSIEYTAGYVSGKLRRWYAARSNSGNLSGLFPMGEFLNNTWKSRHVLLEYNEAPSNGGHLSVEFKNIPMINGALGTQDFITQSNSGNAGFTITNFSDDGYWKIDNQENTLADGKYTIALTGEGFLSLNNSLTQMTMVKRVNGGNWFCPGRHLSTLGDLNSPTLRRSDVSGFSNFGFAGGASNALPISLINFNAECIDEVVYLKWSTASESNNKEFHIEESDDATTWKVVKVIEGAGNSNVTLNYEEKLSSNFPDGSYFRMSQVDYNGDSESFDPVFVYCEKKLKSEVKIYPNPATEFVNVEISSPDEMDMQLTLFSSAGQILLIQKVHLENGFNSVRLDITSLPPGAYHLNLSNDRKLEITGSRSIIKR